MTDAHAAQPPADSGAQTALRAVRQGTAGGTAILQFPLLFAEPSTPRCLWCRHEFAPSKPNQLYCRRKHSQYACECRKAGLVTAVAALLERHGASPQRAQIAACDVVEAHYATGRVQRAVERLGWMYDEVGRAWRMAYVQ